MPELHSRKTNEMKKKKKGNLYTQIEKSLKDVMKIKNKLLNGITVKKMLYEK